MPMTFSMILEDSIKCKIERMQRFLDVLASDLGNFSHKGLGIIDKNIDVISHEVIQVTMADDMRKEADSVTKRSRSNDRPGQ